MWMSEPMPVMTRIISDDSGSTRNASGISRGSDEIHRKSVCWTKCSDAACAWSAAATDTPNAASMARQATPPDTVLGRRLPRNALMTNPASGSSGISAIMSPLERRKGVGAQRLAMTEERDHQREPDRRFGGRDRHDEERDDLAVHRALEAADRHERDVDGVEHDLDRQQDRDQVAPQEDTRRADGEQHARQDQEVVERRHVRAPCGRSPRHRPPRRG